MKIKAKLILGIGLLFAMIIVITVLSNVYIKRLSGDTKNILVANYNTLDYCRQMQIALNNDIADSAQVKKFLINLRSQQHNITETGEKQFTEKLAVDFNKLKNKPHDFELTKLVSTDITDIMLLNMEAIQRKSSVAITTADKSIFSVSMVGIICFLIAFTLMVNLPGNIANPIKELTNSFKEVAAEDYSQRVHFEQKNEFGELAEAFNIMAMKLEEFRAGDLEKLLIEKKRIDTLINNMNDPVIGLDNEQQIIFMNNTALKIAGLRAEDCIGKSAMDVAVHNDLLRSLMQDLIAKGHTEISIRPVPVKIYADNKESYFEKEIIPINIIPTGEKDEKMIGNVILLQNITPYKELDSAKTNFIAAVSHELKTPISSIKMSLQLLENTKMGELNSEQHKLVESISEDADRLLNITGELLNITQVESGSIQLDMRPVEANTILDYALKANQTAAEQKKIKLEINAPENIPKLFADGKKVAWVLTNLVSNAIRYSYDDSVVFIGIEERNDKIAFTVRDTGQGIVPQFKDKIFDRYFRVPGTKKEGTGLGLAISKEFIEAQGGSIEVVSDFGTGSTFTVILNRAKGY